MQLALKQKQFNPYPVVSFPLKISWQCQCHDGRRQRSADDANGGARREQQRRRGKFIDYTRKRKRERGLGHARRRLNFGCPLHHATQRCSRQAGVPRSAPVRREGNVVPNR
jgi:hypothetical protein